MKITRAPQDGNPAKWNGWHILTVGEAGFSMLDVYGRHWHGFDLQVIEQFAERINQKNESGSLHPLAPISAVPRLFFRDHAGSHDAQVLADFRRHISEFLDANRMTIHAKQVLVDFHVSAQPVQTQYLDAAEEILQSRGRASGIEEVVIFT
jgi:hypothetical protein